VSIADVQDRVLAGTAVQRDLLITGFGPFPHVRTNPTATLAAAVARRLGAQVRVLETSYGKGLGDLAGALRTQRPSAVLMLGLAAKARHVRVECFARPGSSPLNVDATGRLPGKAPTGTKYLLRSTASTGQALASLRRHGIRAGLSASAGRYLCNAGYALALGHATHAGIPVLFIHIPWLRPAPGTRRTGSVRTFRPAATQLTAALAEIARGLAIAARQTVPE
jgi:pyroglutamyl-peptidase